MNEIIIKDNLMFSGPSRHACSQFNLTYVIYEENPLFVKRGTKEAKIIAYVQILLICTK